MDSRVISPKTISVKKLIELKDQKVKPIDNLNIPNITIPAHLLGKKRPTESDDSLSVNIRLLFNSLTPDNIAIIRERLRSIIVEKARTPMMIEEIAQEILSNFLVSESLIKNAMYLLNAVHTACVQLPPSEKTDKKLVSPTIGNYFLEKCRSLIYKSIHTDNIRRLATMDIDDMDQLDAYNRDREKIINLIITICSLYEQRKTTYIKLGAPQIYGLMNDIFTIYSQLQTKMKELGNPYEEDCQDEDEYETLRKMCNLYAEHLYTFMSKEAKEFQSDATIIKDKTLSQMVERFQKEIVPTLTEAYLISKCEAIEY